MMLTRCIFRHGRRKTATARVRIVEGTGKLVANGREFEDYFSHENFAKQAYSPLLTVRCGRNSMSRPT